MQVSVYRAHSSTWRAFFVSCCDIAVRHLPLHPCQRLTPTKQSRPLRDSAAILTSCFLPHPALLEVHPRGARVGQHVPPDWLHRRKHRHRARVAHALVHQHHRNLQILQKNLTQTIAPGSLTHWFTNTACFCIYSATNIQIFRVDSNTNDRHTYVCTKIRRPHARQRARGEDRLYIREAEPVQ